MFGTKKKKSPAKSSGVKRKIFSIKIRRSDVGKIFLTTDGFFGDKQHIKKPRKVVAIKQRKDDGAIAVSKIFSKAEKNGRAYIENVVLLPERHPSLTEASIVGSSVIFGVKKKDGTYKAIYKGDFIDVNDALSKKEIKKIQKNVQSDTKQHRKTYKRTIKKWKKHFK